MNDRTANLAAEVERVAGDEPIEAIVIGTESSWNDDLTYGMPAFQPATWTPGKVISWAEARPHLDHEYDNGYGGADCPAICAWTLSRVIFVDQYDGATSVTSVQRHPVDHRPEMPGGG